MVNVLLGAAVISLFAFNMVYSLAYSESPGYSGLTWALAMTGLLLVGGLVQLARFAFDLFESRGELALSLLLLALGMAVDLYVWASVVASFRIPHLAPLYVVAGYWSAYYGEIVVKSILRQRRPGGVLHRTFVTREEEIAQLRAQLAARAAPAFPLGGNHQRPAANSQPVLFDVPGVRRVGATAEHGEARDL